jgi:hypothetical protein
VTGRVRCQVTGLGAESDQCTHTPTDVSDQDDLCVRSVAESWVLPPMATFSMGLINRPPTGHLKGEELRKHAKGVPTPF